MNNTEFLPSVHWVGVNDRRGQLFENLWPLTDGMSYNSYLVIAGKVALIDTVEADFAQPFLKKLHDILGDRRIDYLVINHMEPDHSSSLAALRKVYPEITVVGNKRTLEMVDGYYGHSEHSLCVADGEKLSLDGLTLRFLLTPMVHWPETMVTVCEERKAVFTGDAFGTFGALDGIITDDDGDTSRYDAEMLRYYSNIVGKYGAMVERAVKKLCDAGVCTDYLCPTHGPVWHQRSAEVVGRYLRWAKYEPEGGALIVYGSMYGNTAAAAEYLASALATRGVRNITVRNASATSLSRLIADAFRCGTILVGAPTYNGEIFPPVAEFMQALTARGLKNRTFGAFGSFTWAGTSVCKLTTKATDAGWMVLDASHDFKQGFAQNDPTFLDILADQAAATCK